MQIGEVAELTEMSLRTLRHYDEVGLLRPSARSEGGFRLYTRGDLEKLLVIRRMKPLGYTLDQMLEVRELTEKMRAELPGPSPESQTQLRAVLADAKDRRDRLRRHLLMVDEFIGILESRMPPDAPAAARSPGGGHHSAE
jgi:DNA-binding transcriptional MerR regulator